MPPSHARSTPGPARARPALTSAELVAFGVHAAADAGLPIQVHVGLGDRDLDLRRADPLLLAPLLAQPHIARVPVLLLHCYPFHREAGYLAQAFGHVFIDVGLAVNHLGARSVELLAESPGAGTVRQAAVLVGRLRTAGAAPARRGAVAARDGQGARPLGGRTATGRRPTRRGWCG